VQRDARAGSAQAEQEATIVEAQARQAAEVKAAEADALIAQAQRDLEMKRAQYEASIATERSRAAQAGPLAQAEAERAVIDAKIILAEREAQRKERELEALVVKPARAERRSIEIKAQANRERLVREGEGEAERVRVIGLAEADTLRAKLEAEATGLRLKLEAEAQGLEAKALAMQKLNDASMSLQVATELIHVLPQMLEAANRPLEKIGELRVIDFGGGNGASPVQKILGLTPQGLSTLNETLRATLGFSLREAVASLRSGDATLFAGMKSPAAQAPPETNGKSVVAEPKPPAGG